VKGSELNNQAITQRLNSIKKRLDITDGSPYPFHKPSHRGLQQTYWLSTLQKQSAGLCARRFDA